MGNSLAQKTPSFISIDGIITVFPLKHLSTAYLAAYSLETGFTLKLTPALLLKFVFTGPGQKNAYPYIAL